MRAIKIGQAKGGACRGNPTIQERENTDNRVSGFTARFLTINNKKKQIQILILSVSVN